MQNEKRAEPSNACFPLFLGPPSNYTGPFTLICEHLNLFYSTF